MTVRLAAGVIAASAALALLGALPAAAAPAAGAATPSAAPAAAAAPAAVAARRAKVTACVWETRAPLQTIKCGRPFEQSGTISFAQCWRERPASAVVFRRVEGQWRSTSIGVRVFGQARACPRSFPWKTVATIPTTRSLKSARQVMALAVTASGGAVTRVQFGLCGMDERSTLPCAK